MTRLILDAKVTRMDLPLFGRNVARFLAILALVAFSQTALRAQAPVAPSPPDTAAAAPANGGNAVSSIIYKIQGPNERMEMIVNTSRIISLEHKIPKFVVNDQEKVRVTPLSAYQLQVAAIKTGVTQINLWDDKDNIHTLDLIIYGDARELQLVLEDQFPQSALKVRPLANSVIISGYVDRPDYVNRIVRIAEDYYPKVVNNITVGGVQQVQLHCKVMEVSRTKLRNFGFDFSTANSGDFFVSSVSGLINAATASTGVATGLGGDTVRFGIVGDNSAFFGFLEALRQYDLAKVLSEPTLTTVSGRPAFFEVGGEFPIPIPQSLGTITIEYKSFGTRLDFVPIVLGNGNIRLEVRPMVSEIDTSRGVTLNTFVVPAIRKRQVDTGVELKAGQTLALAGLLQYRTESQNKGIPWVADLPWIGAAFRRVHEEVNEIELLVLVTPELVDAMDCEEVPPCGPGMHSVSPCDVDMYWRGYMEVPRCDGACGPGFANGQSVHPLSPNGHPTEVVPPGNGRPAPKTAPPPAAKSGASKSSINNLYVRTSEPTSAATTSSRRGAAKGSDPGIRPADVALPATRSPVSPSSVSSSPGGSSKTVGTPQRKSPAATSASSPSTGPNGSPGLIGPIGYDVVE
jgi:pilus assembly protein CpaC